jgi:hypothetical protein
MDNKRSLGPTCLLILVFLFTCSLIAVGQAPVPKLTLPQVEELVTHHVPDSTMSTQIHSRGVAFAVTSAVIDSLRAKGAGPQTLAVLQALIGRPAPAPVHSNDAPRSPAETTPRRHGPADPGWGNMEVKTEPGSHLFLDGKEVGGAGNVVLGVFQMNQVAAGKHDLSAQKPGYQDAHLALTLANREDKHVLVPMEWNGGYLTIFAQPADAQIHAEGPQPFDGAGVNVKCLPGTYTITASADGYASQTRTFRVLAGEHHTERAQLAVDPGFIVDRLSAAAAELSAGDSATAIADARRVLKLSPADAQAKEILAEASYQAGDIATFVSAGRETIRAGGTVTVLLMHVHNFPRRMIHRTTITLSNAGIAVASTPPVNNCKIPALIAFNQISQAEVQRDPAGVITLHLAYLARAADKARLIGSIHDLDFVVDGSSVVRTPGTVVLIGGQSQGVQSAQNAEQLLGGVQNLIVALRN